MRSKRVLVILAVLSILLMTALALRTWRRGTPRAAVEEGGSVVSQLSHDSATTDSPVGATGRKVAGDLRQTVGRIADGGAGLAAARAPRMLGGGTPVRLEDIPVGSRLRSELQALSPEVRARALIQLTKLSFPVEDVASLHVNIQGEVYYVCDRPPRARPPSPEPTTAVTESQSASQVFAADVISPVPIDSPPIRHSRLGATKVLYLDFNGHSIQNTAWNEATADPLHLAVAVYVAVPYDTDGDPTTFCAEEQVAIIQTWERVAEDYVPFDVDVSTEEPIAMTNFVARALFTKATDANGVSLPGTGVSSVVGIAYPGGFGETNFAQRWTPCFVFFDRLSSPADYADVAAHELGHNLGLSHDGQLADVNQPAAEYYYGHGTGELSWSPLMGGAGSCSITQWSNGKYYRASNTQDDLDLIAGKLAYRTDDVGNTLSTATSATVTDSSISASGIIETETDIDVFQFEAPSGSISISSAPLRSDGSTNGGNLDLKLELANSAGNQVAVADPSGTAAQIDTIISAGRYYLSVLPVGTGTPLVNPPSGYTRYGSIGQYTITGTIIAAAPTITSAATALGHRGESFSYTVTATNSPTSFDASGLPAGINLNATTGVITGMPSESGTFTVTLTARNSGGTDSATLTVTITPGEGPWVTNVVAERRTGTRLVDITFDLSHPQNLPCTITVEVSLDGGANWLTTTLTLTGAVGAGVTPGSGKLVTWNAGTDWPEQRFTATRVRVMADDSPGAGPVPVGMVLIPAGTFMAGAPYVVWSYNNVTLPAFYMAKTETTWAEWVSVRDWAVTHGYPDLASVGAGKANDHPVHSVSWHDTIKWLNAKSERNGLVPVYYTDVDQTKVYRTGIVDVLGETRLGWSGNQVKWTADGYRLPTEAEWEYAARGGLDGKWYPWGDTITQQQANYSSYSVVNGVLTRDPPSIYATGDFPYTSPVGAFPANGYGLFDVAGNVLERCWAGAYGDDVRGGSWNDTVCTCAFTFGGWVVRDDTVGFRAARTPGAFSSASSAAFELNLAGPPTITTQPQSRTVFAGANVTFSVAASGNPAPTYQWQKDGATITGATVSTLNLPVVSVADAGSYTVVVTNTGGSVTSAAASLAVNPLITPTITTQLAARTVTVGSSTTFTVVATGAPVPTYQWNFNGAPLAGATGSTLTLNNVSPANAGSYTVTVSNIAGSVTTNPAYLFVPTVTPAAKEVGAGRVVYQLLVESNPAWTASSNAAWATPSPLIGSIEGNIEVTVDSNATGADRTATLTIGGLTHTLIQRAAGTALRELWSVGSDSVGQLGVNRLLQRAIAAQIDTNVQAVAGGSLHSLWLKEDGTLWATGSNNNGQLGDGTTAHCTPPVQVATGVTRIAAGLSHSLFVKTNGTLWAMGNNANGQLGDGTTIQRAMPVQVATGVTRIAAGFSHSLFVKTDGTLWAMGSNDSGQFGDGTTTQRSTPVQVATGVARIAAGLSHSLFVKTDGTLWAMGNNSYGQLGDGTTTQRATPVQVATGIASIAAGWRHSLFVTTDGTLWAMGDDYFGQLGNGVAFTIRTTPVQVATGVASIAASGGHSLFVKTDGTLWAMGYNGSGQLGDGTTTQRAMPVQAATGVVTIAASGSHSLFVKADGTLWAMGDNSSGQLGDGAPQRSLPVQAASGVNLPALGDSHGFYIDSSGVLWAMGDNNYGQLGDGTTTRRAVPAQVAGGVAKIAAGNTHSLFAKTDDTLWAMGYNGSGQLGDGTTTQRPMPVQVAIGVAGIAAGNTHSLFVKTDGTLWAVGNNSYGQLGDGTTTQRTAAVQVATAVASITAGWGHSLFVKTDGTLWAMGSNENGQLGDGTTTQRPTPVQVATGVAGVAARSSQSLFVKTDGTLWAMGNNSYGQLGDGTTTRRATPVQVATGVAKMAAGNYHSLFVKTDGALWAMGYNYYGQLGDGTTVQRLKPVPVAIGVQEIVAGGNHSAFIVVGDWRPTTALPQITSFSPAAIMPAMPVVISGSGFAMVTSVQFNGVNATSFTVDSPTQITAVAPAGVSAGTISVTTINATSTSPTPYTTAIAPMIAIPPSASQTVVAGTAVTFTVVATGTGPLSYQWRKNGVNIGNDSRITGATTVTLSIAAVATADAGIYSVVVSNAAGSVPSNDATLAVVDARATHGVAGGGYFAGGTVTVASTVTYAGTLSGLGWSVLPPAGWSYASGSGSEGDVKPAVGDTSLLEWAWTTIPASPVTFSYTLNVPAGETGTKTLAALVLPRQSGTQFQVLVQPDPLAIDQVTHHAADTNRDFRISLVELLRVIELYNTRDGTVRTGAYGVDASNPEDGFSTDPARSNTAVVTLTRYHSGDSNHDGRLSLTELLRVIELYNTRSGTVRTGQYRVQAGTEDGFDTGS